MTVAEIIDKYKSKIDYLDLEILIANSLGKTREFVLIHPECILTNSQQSEIDKNSGRRMKGEPIAYILGHKEFYGLDFIVNKHTLVPRPETELIVEDVIEMLRGDMQHSEATTTIIDIGTGSGNIIISVAHSMEHGAWSTKQKSSIKYFGADISVGALKTAKKNAKLYGLDKKIKFLHGNLLKPVFETLECLMLHAPCSIIITANLPYLSRDIYQSAPIDVLNFEPKSALYSPKAGLDHYEKLLKQLQKSLAANRELSTTVFLEISPEQKHSLAKIIKSIFPQASIEFEKDLANKWRVCKIIL